jgi:hypothetical protein
VKARPTVYNGITMRSRLEADFAREFLDDPDSKFGAWEYEPVCFAGPGGQYLPDFRTVEDQLLGVEDCAPTYHELKPYRPEILRKIDAVDRWLTRMTIIWDSDVDATLILHLWQYGGAMYASIIGIAGTWRLMLPEYGQFIWPGMGQEQQLAGAQHLGAWRRARKAAG